MTKKELGPRYNHKQVEERIYSLWEESGYFNPDNLPKKLKAKEAKPFCIIMPPPNANGALHIGHAVFVTLQDIMSRFYRMRGRRALWLPGADHAGFETQVVYDKKLEKEGRSRFEIDRDKLFKEIWDFTQLNKTTMENQLRKLGASCDWSREKFTLDPKIVEEVQKTFVRMHEDGLIYRDVRLVNWCVKHQTALSDLEVVHAEQKDPLYYIKYGPFTLATVRPETKFGDTAVAVHPKDKRYKQYVGEEVEVEGLLGSFKIKVIEDEAVNPEFGTGAVKVTPAHDFNDFEMGERHKLEARQVIDRYGRLNGKTGTYSGMKVDEARTRVVEDLKRQDLLEKIDEEYNHAVAVCYKCKKQLEPLLLPQWWVKTGPLAKKAIKAIKKKEIEYHPDSFRKITLNWLNNIRDWNISRQITWGIRIPAWLCQARMSNVKAQMSNGDKLCEPVISLEQPKKCPSCGGTEMVQDPDVFDTWFSSGQWPYLTLGFRDGEGKSKDMEDFYPTDVLETAGDIIFFWVARMIMMGLYRVGEAPFRHVYLHGLVRDKDRQKMSKSKGNVIDPLGVADTYGTDAVRMALVAGNTAGQDSVISEDKIRGFRNFATKVWNIARFILMNIEGEVGEIELSADDKKVLEEVGKAKRRVAGYLETFKFHQAAEEAYHYIWHTFADKIIEEMKPRLNSEDKDSRRAACLVLSSVFKECLKMLHPFMPFLTEEIYQKFNEGRNGNLLMMEEW